MKIRSIMVFALALCLLLSTMGTAFAADEKAEVIIWHTFTDLQDETLNEIADSFNQSQDEVTVVVQSQPYANFESNVQSAVANGVGPNIIFNYASTAADYVDDGKVADLGKYLDDPEIGIEGFKDSIPEALYLEASSFTDGKIHSIPMVTTGPIIFYNKTIYDELNLTAPTTWDELAENCKAIYEAKGIPGFAVDSVADLMHALILQNGSEYIDTESKTVLFNNEKTIERVEWYAENVQAGYFTLVPTGDYWSSDFNAGLIASYLGSCAGVPYITPDGFEYAVAPMPQQGEVEWFPAWNRSVIVFSADEAVERGAYEFAKYFISPENNAKWCIAMTALSPYAATGELEEYKAFVEANPALAAVEANVPFAGFLPTVTGAYEVRQELDKAARLAASGSVTAAEAIEEAEIACNEALQN